MEFTKSTLKKQIEVQKDEDGNSLTVEVFDGRFQADIQAGDTMESMRSELHRWLDRKFNDLFAAELGLMPERVKEGERWKQVGLFDDAL